MKWVVFCWSDSLLPPEGISPEDFIVCADSGLEYALRCGIRPNLLLGDFDSYPREKLPAGIETLVLPAEKDDTDAMFAIRTGLERGYDRILLAGGIGGRPDHTVGALMALNYAAQRGAEAICSDGRSWMELFRGPCRKVYFQDRRIYFSVLPWGGPALGVTLEGMKYPLHNATLLPDFPLGVSNELAQPQASVEVQQGTLLIVRCGEAIT